MKYRRCRVGDVLTLRRSQVVPEIDKSYDEIGIRSFGKGVFHKEPVTGAELGDKRVFEIHDGDLVLSNVFAWEGAIAVAGPAEDGRIGSHRFMTYVPLDDQIDTNWAHYFFLSEGGIELIRKASPGSAGRNRTLAIDRFEDLEIPLPDIDEQRRVAAKLDAALERRLQISELSQRTTEVSAALVASLGHVSAPLKPIGEFVEQIRRPISVDPATEYRLLGVRWYGEGLFVREVKNGVDIAANTLYKIEEGDFVYNRLFGWKGSFAIAETDEDGCFVSGEFPTFRVDSSQLDARYLLALFRNPATWDRAFDRSTGGTPTSRNRLKEAEFISMTIPVPDLSIQARIADFVDKAVAVGSLRDRRTKFLAALDVSVLNNAFAGVL